MNNEKLIPKLRFPSYSSEWHSYTLGEILTFYSTNSFSREKLNYDTGSVKNIHYGDIHTKFPSIVSVSDNKDIPFINNEIDLSKYSEDQYLQNGDLIIADASEDYEDIGKAIEVKNIDDEKVLAGLHTILARDNNNITVNGFKAYLFSTNSLKTKIKIIANGISVLGISKNSLSKLTVNVPSKNEQNDVVDFISLIDNKIELLEQKHQYYLDFKKFLMQQIFAQKLRFKDDEIWKTVKLGDICNITMGQSPSSENYTENNSHTILIQGNADIIDGKIVPRVYTSEITKISKPGDIIMTVRAPVGDLAINEFESCIGRGVCSIEGNKFIYYLLQSLKDKHVWERLSQGSTFESINSNDIKNLKTSIPSKETQETIYLFLTEIDNKIDFFKIQYLMFQKFKKGLLQQMFI